MPEPSLQRSANGSPPGPGSDSARTRRRRYLYRAELTYHAASSDAATRWQRRFGCNRVLRGSAIDTMRPVLTTIVLLTISNVFMTFAWYAHLRELSHKPWIVAALVSWGIALFDYLWAGLCILGAVYFIFRGR